MFRWLGDVYTFCVIIYCYSCAAEYSGVHSNDSYTINVSDLGFPSQLSTIASVTSLLMAAQFTTLMSSMQQSMASFRTELCRDQEETVEKAAKKARLSAEVTFRRKRNEKQYRFNEIVQDKLSTAALHIEEATASSETSVPTATSATGSTQHSLTGVGASSSGLMSALKQAREAVEEGMELVRSRQKAIMLADRSELGWAVVNEYGEDELADDSMMNCQGCSNS